jgi:hypothetical protein
MRRYTFLFLITPLFFAVCQGDENGVREICDGNGSNANLVRNPATSDLALDTTTWRVLSTQWPCNLPPPHQIRIQQRHL